MVISENHAEVLRYEVIILKCCHYIFRYCSIISRSLFTNWIFILITFVHMDSHKDLLKSEFRKLK